MKKKFKIFTVIGTRPQFVKAAVVSREIINNFSDVIQETIIHTGQHYDENMSDLFFNELDIPLPKYHLNINKETHGKMTGKMMIELENILLTEKPDMVLIYGDTNSTLAAAIVSIKIHLLVAHVEAGLRCFNMNMPEEINRILSDKVSSLLFCPSEEAVKNLYNEGIKNGVSNVGDVMYDASLFYKDKAEKKSNILKKYNLNNRDYVLVTCHREENTDFLERLKSIFEALSIIAEEKKIILPLHPRTKKYIDKYELNYLIDKILIIEPIGFLDMIQLEVNASIIITDSGGIQKEAFFFKTPCITIRDETEWIETVELGYNKIVGANKSLILKTFRQFLDFKLENTKIKPYGNGRSAKIILNKIVNFLNLNQLEI